MCGRYQFSMHQDPVFERIVQQAQQRNRQFSELRVPLSDPAALPGCGAATDIAPTQVAPVMIASGGRVVAEFQRWGLPGWNGGLVINARAETVTEKPMFRRSIAAQRCAVPASCYYEWDGSRRKFRFRRAGQPLYLAGIYDVAEGENRFVILTTAPNASVEGIHDRMPLILTREQVRPWLTDPGAALELLAHRPPHLERECCDAQLCLEDLLPGH